MLLRGKKSSQWSLIKMINFEKFTNYAQEIIFAANAKKDFYKNTEVQPEHILLAMIEDKGIAKDYLAELKLLNQHFINEVVARVKSFPTISTPSRSGQVFLSKDTITLFEYFYQKIQILFSRLLLARLRF